MAEQTEDILSGIEVLLCRSDNPRDIALTMLAVTTTVEVSGAAPVVDTTNPSIGPGFTRQEVALLPNPGGDVTNMPRQRRAPRWTTPVAMGISRRMAFR